MASTTRSLRTLQGLKKKHAKSLSVIFKPSAQSHTDRHSDCLRRAVDAGMFDLDGFHLVMSPEVKTMLAEGCCDCD